ncbi:hypothetical protein A7A76_21555 [Lysobacter enzymogenes]|uniref:g-type lysozyme inhibitor n=1 Tax=Lysobacter enzymogenes TaxID=69 RepID=UPI0019D0D7F4|nr:g-type lysozyme inhibitor [Lysobacter enzymogenes]MBN7137308.1 hypothetical protein [Lysobacter enzymogenes]
MIVRTVALAVALMACANAALAADAVKQVPVHFAKGAVAATVQGAIKGDDSVEYLVVARAGQTLRVAMSGSSNANLNVYPPAAPGEGGEALTLDTVYGKTGATHSVRLPADGQYRLQVYQPRAAARRGTVSKFALKIEVR